MDDDTPPTTTKNKGLRAAGLLAAGAIAGGVMAGALTANAASTGTTGDGTTATAPAMGARPPAGAMRAARVRPGESTPSRDIVATLTKAAKAEVPGGTVVRVETDAGDGAYEAHMQKADGTLVTVKFDKNLDVTGVEDGMGMGDPMPNCMPAPRGNTPPTSPSSRSGAA
jgi:hypothetical protein